LILSFPRTSVAGVIDDNVARGRLLTTVGYGHKYPVTPEGRAVAVVLMFLGIALFGVITATLASFFVEHQSQSEFQQVMACLDALEERLLGTDPARTDEGPAENLPSESTSESN
jgi:voltage-gated potassium channel Kch